MVVAAGRSGRWTAPSTSLDGDRTLRLMVGGSSDMITADGCVWGARWRAGAAEVTGYVALKA